MLGRIHEDISQDLVSGSNIILVFRDLHIRVGVYYVCPSLPLLLSIFSEGCPVHPIKVGVCISRLLSHGILSLTPSLPPLSLSLSLLLIQTYLPRYPNPRKKLLVTCAPAPPNPKCYVCSPKPEVGV